MQELTTNQTCFCFGFRPLLSFLVSFATHLIQQYIVCCGECNFWPGNVRGETCVGRVRLPLRLGTQVSIIYQIVCMSNVRILDMLALYIVLIFTYVGINN